MYGQTFGKLIVIGGPYKRVGAKNTKAYSPCYCTCNRNPGKAHFIANDGLKNGHTKSCGCILSEWRSEMNKIQKVGNKYGRNNLRYDLVGKRIGVLEGIAPTDKRDASGHAVWQFRNVITGEIEEHTRNHVLNGHTNGGSKNPEKGSVGELRIAEILQNNKIIFEKEKTFKGLIGDNNTPLRYDFFLPEFNVLIEFDGEQHFRYNSIFYKDKESFEEQQHRDLIKNNFAKENHIVLIRIPYIHLKDLCIDDLLPGTSTYTV